MTRLLTVLELALLAAASWPGARLLFNPHFVRVAPRVHAVLAAAAGTLAVLVLILALRAPGWLHPIAALAIAAFLATWWRARPAFGRSRGLPPGSLSLVQSIEAIVDRGYYARQHLRHGPIFKMAQFHRSAVCVVGLERGHRLLRTHRDALGPSPLPFNHEIPGGFLRYMDAKTHGVYGSLFRAAFAGAAVSAAASTTRQVARRELAAMAAVCASAGGGVRPAEFLERIVFAAFVRVMLDVEPDTPVYRELEALHAVLRAQSLSRSLTATTRAVLGELRRLVLAESVRLRERMARGDDSPCALATLVRADPAMPDATSVDNLVFILKISSANVVSLLHWLLRMLGEHPVWLDRVRAEAAGAHGAAPAPAVADRIVMETLRLEQSEYVYRVIREDFEHEGVRFLRGWQLRLCVKESHRSAEVFPDPETFDPDRFLGHTVTRSEYSPFGADHHACNGVELTQMISRVLVEELARGFDLAIARDGHLERDFRHWSHWRPSSKLRLAISHRSRPSSDRHGARRVARPVVPAG